MSDKQFDIIVLGANGYTGKITAEYLARERDEASFAIAGRNTSELQKIKNELQDIDRTLSNLTVISCDVTDPSQLASLTSKTKVLINCVGPYRLFGEEVVKACILNGTHYIDVTGEPPFVQMIVEKYHEEAEKKKLYILPACGIGSLIPDVVVEDIKESFAKQGSRALDVKGYIKYNGRYSKTMSNGTWRTLVESFSRRRGGPRPSRQTTTSTSGGSEQRKRGPKRVGFHYFKGSWAVPFVEGADLHVVRRTNALTMDQAGSPNFSYSQYTLMPLFPPLWLISTLFMVVIAMFFAKFGFVRNLLLKRNIPDRGPTKEQRSQSSVDFTVYAQDNQRVSKTLKLHTPGPYDCSGICAVEAALCLISEKVNTIYGVVTPGAVMNMDVIMKRLIKRGITVEGNFRE
eukprot:TRINITY_DN714_c0_g1_i1.p1 TRINITY_DN714_c0_g1~~TRINITY_DN714_c0_g1_i1.p1  ORF type:complete len:425 (+),score=73.34 TRINITY_DN714_c0_g1_i1:70-1275(+)